MLDRISGRAPDQPHTSEDRYKLIYRIAVGLLLLIFAGLQFRLWIGDGSLAQIHHLQKMRAELARSNAAAEKRNNAMAAQIEDLKSGSAATEGRARAEMGMIKPGETFFLTVSDPSRDQGTDVTADTADSQD